MYRMNRLRALQTIAGGLVGLFVPIKIGSAMPPACEEVGSMELMGRRIVVRKAGASVACA